MTLDQIRALPIAEMAAPDCFLFVWIPLPFTPQVAPIMSAWGFNFSGSAFVWAKRTSRDLAWHMGGGFGTGKNAEVCWLGRRGNPKRLSCGVRELIVAPVREHSRKPDEQYARMAEYGFDSDVWVGHVCDLSIDQTLFDGEMVDHVKMTPVSKPSHYGDQTKTAAEPTEWRKPDLPPQAKEAIGEFGGGDDADDSGEFGTPPTPKKSEPTKAAAAPPPQATLRHDMDDEIPF
jgi:hypothetical protein